METAATIAVKLCQEMRDTKLPNAGNYIEGIPGPYGPVGQIANAQLIALYFAFPWGVDYLKQPAWTADTTPGNTTGVPHLFATAAEMLGIEYLVQRGMVFDDIVAVITEDPLVVLNDLYAGSDLLTDVLHACIAAGWPQNNDPLNVFGVNWEEGGT